ncbi:sensor histidine kinase [Sporomusa acidovorans]|uniref:sensor histidine kinase n=1 Tax=Sporomusa acidovorans TaxID=112900 RepID=UPI00088E1D69|nr:ATP-binding protein [Sporomusa acidovorans]OZC19131.1 alkaline phosphatase synthesis sensor protein PhoR [Sporomusa acidovorans DSM 3132]SDD68208.1 two-component system, OmpR family, sensor histidine kinase BaeS [Sporomusa acidovorans]
MNSIIYRITGLMFLAVAITVFLLIYLANSQMTDLFQEYVTVQHMEMHRSMMTHMNPGGHGQAVMMGIPEQNFLTSVHQSLIWVGVALLVAGLAASYALARSITIPLRKVSAAALEIERGNFAQKVPVTSKDEVGSLALIFNSMAETLDNNNKLRQQFLANIAHELRTPLAVIQGHLEGMIDGIIEPNQKQLTSLHEEAVRLSRLIKDLKDLSLAEVRQLSLEVKEVAVNQTIEQALYMLKPLADEKEIIIKQNLTQELPPITADADRICQIFYNLITNAIRYTATGGEVTVSTELTTLEEQDWVKVTVADNGPGINAFDLPYIFDHFYRGDKSRDRKSGGTGLGLAIVKQLAEIHGGKVQVESTVGKGSSFYVMLPAKVHENTIISSSVLHSDRVLYTYQDKAN